MPEVERAARFVATHALLLLGLGLLAAAASIGVIVWATHLAARFGHVARYGVATLGLRPVRGTEDLILPVADQREQVILLQ